MLALLLFSGTARAADPPFFQQPDFPFAGPDAARGALVWVPGTYGRDQTGPPPPPDFVHRESASGLDVFCYFRPREDDPLPRGGETLAAGLQALRERGYRRIIVAGHSRGAWIALTALAHPGLADGIAAFSPAAHGTRDERRLQAMTDWDLLWRSAVDNGTQVVLAQLSDDAWDPDPAARLAVARRRLGDRLLSIFMPAEPKGHAGVYEPAFDEQFGARIAAFLH